MEPNKVDSELVVPPPSTILTQNTDEHRNTLHNDLYTLKAERTDTESSDVSDINTYAPRYIEDLLNVFVG